MQGMLEKLHWYAKWRIEKFASDEDFQRHQPYAVSEFSGNLALNEGINELLLLLVGGGGDAYDNTNTYLGVGDSSTAAAAAQTGLQAAVNKFWQGMEATYPTDPPVSEEVVFRAIFADGDAEYAWEEFTVVNASDDTGKNLCRKVSSEGTKGAGDTWTLTYTLGIS